MLQSFKIKLSLLLGVGLLLLTVGILNADPVNHWQDCGTGLCYTTGNVGTGTTTPTEKLVIQTATGNYGVVHTDGTVSVGTWAGAGATGAPGGWYGTKSNHKLHFFTNDGAARMTIDTAGNVGIGTVNPTERLTVAGNISATSDKGVAVRGESNSVFSIGVEGHSDSNYGVVGESNRGIGLVGVSISGEVIVATLANQNCISTTTACNIFRGQNQVGNLVRIDSAGKGFFNGGTQTGGADFAESMRTTDDPATLQPGDVLVIDPGHARAVKKSSAPNSKLVVGVYSVKPSILAIADHHIDDSLTGEVPVAVVGIVPTKVSAENGPIQIGDLLVSSSTPGHAMRAPNNPAPGTIIGKALATWESGNGVIEVMVMLR
ncbi:hypothetical protein HYR54_03740 [Candidatus Acetothermia bacterium]|nr:hypothetical protein [Candidatus Acetothermia bacterium]